MERLMAATSQRLLQGGMRTRDWFSDKLGGEGRRRKVGLDGEVEGYVKAD